MQSSTLPRLRPYRASDAPFVEKLARRAFSEYSPRAGAPSVHAAELPEVSALVAVMGDSPVGFAMITVRPHRGDGVVPAHRAVASLDAIAVEPEERGHGVGRALLAGAEREAKRRRARELRLVTAEANVAALDLFLRSGFAI